MHKPNYTNQFRKDIKRLQKRGLDMNQIKGVMSTLINAKPLESKHKNHALIGNLKGYSECHVAPD
jgi:mRNA interferase YafQ